MNWIQQIGNILENYSDSRRSDVDENSTNDDFDQVVQSAPREKVSEGIGEAFRSDKTPPFEQMLSQLFSRSDGTQKAGLLNMLLEKVGPGVLSQLGLGQNSTGVSVSDANKVSPKDIEMVAAKERSNNPGFLDSISSFYASHPTLVKQLGSVALTIALSRIAKNRRIM